MRFWDSSALVPLLMTQPLSSKTDKWVAEDGELAVWTLTPIELASAVLRLVREGALQETAANQAESRIDELMGSCHVGKPADVEPNLRWSACDVSAVHRA